MNRSSNARVGLYADLSYRQDELGISTTTPFVAWLAALSDHLDELVIFGRTDPSPGRSAFPLPEGPRLRFVPLPFYESLRAIGAVASAARATLQVWRTEIRHLDAVIVFGPHPLGDLLALWARRAGLLVVAGVREDLEKYLRHRTALPWSGAAVALARSLEVLHKAAARDAGAVVVGNELARRYEGRRRQVLATGVSLVSSRDIDAFNQQLVTRRPWPGNRLVVGIGRLDPEKNPFLYLDLAEKLQALGPWSVELAGTGRLASPLQAAIDKRRLTSVLTLRGRLGRADIWELLRRGTLLVSTSLTEGQPQVFYEAAICGLPIIAPSVGGVANALGNGNRGVIVPPGDVGAIVNAILDLDQNALRRETLVANAWQWAATDTTEAQTGRVAAFVGSLLDSHRCSGPSNG